MVSFAKIVIHFLFDTQKMCDYHDLKYSAKFARQIKLAFDVSGRDDKPFQRLPYLDRVPRRGRRTCPICECFRHEACSGVFTIYRIQLPHKQRGRSSRKVSTTSSTARRTRACASNWMKPRRHGLFPRVSLQDRDRARWRPSFGMKSSNLCRGASWMRAFNHIILFGCGSTTD